LKEIVGGGGKIFSAVLSKNKTRREGTWSPKVT
jgi:hypothetical protein